MKKRNLKKQVKKETFVDFYTHLATKRFNIIRHKYNYDLSTNMFIAFIIAIIVFCLMSISFYLNSIQVPIILTENNLKFNVQVQKDLTSCTHKRQLDGVCLEKLSYSNIHPVSVMIENHTEARPVSGLDKAQLVYEALVEGHITRFLAVFATHQNIDKIGPIRSARPYFLPFAKELNSMYVHVGGSPEALDLIPHYNILDFNQYSKGPYFWRSKKRFAPHNVYISSENLYQGLEDYHENPDPQFETWRYKDNADIDTRGNDSQSIYIKYSNILYDVNWLYNQEQNSYQRYQNKKAYITDQNKKIWAKNIIVMFSSTKVIDSVGRRDIEVIGEGKALAYRDGKEFELIWKKPSVSKRLLFFSKVDGQEFIFNSGMTWVNLVPNLTEIKVTEKIEDFDL